MRSNRTTAVGAPRKIDQMTVMIDKLNTNIKQVQTLASQVGEGEGKKTLEQLATDLGYENEKAFQRMLKEQYKLTIDKEGKIKSSETGIEVKDLKTYMINMGDSLEKLAQESKTKQNR